MQVDNDLCRNHFLVSKTWYGIDVVVVGISSQRIRFDVQGTFSPASSCVLEKARSEHKLDVDIVWLAGWELIQVQKIYYKIMIQKRVFLLQFSSYA